MWIKKSQQLQTISSTTSESYSFRPTETGGRPFGTIRDWAGSELGYWSFKIQSISWFTLFLEHECPRSLTESARSFYTWALKSPIPSQLKSVKGEPVFLWWAHLYSEIWSPKYPETEISICLLVEPVGSWATQEFSKSLLRKTPLLWRFL